MEEEKEAMKRRMHQLLSEDNDIKQFVKEGTKLLEVSEKPNIITLAQFEPFVELFRVDKDRYAEKDDYYYAINRLYNRYRTELNINLYQPTIVVNNLTERKEVVFLNRVFTRVRPDDVSDGPSSRDRVPALPRAALTTQEQLLMEASLTDLVAANVTEKQKAFFNRIRGESAILQKRFLETNASQKVRDEVARGQEGSTDPQSASSTKIDFELDDDD